MPEHESGNRYRGYITREEAARLEASGYSEPLLEENGVRFYVLDHPIFEPFSNSARVTLLAEPASE